MTQTTVEKTSVSLLGLGAMGTALARAKLLADQGAEVAGSAAEAVAAHDLVVL